MKLSSKTGQRHTSGKQALVDKMRLSISLPAISHANIAHTNISKINVQHLVNSVKVVAKEDISIKPRNANLPRMMLIKLS